MKFGALAASFGLVLGLLTLAGCGSSTTPGGTATTDGGDKKDPNKDTPTPAGDKKGLKGGKATISGSVKYDGDAPELPLPASAKESLAKKPDEEKHCLNEKASPYEKSDPLWKVNKENKGVQYAVVFLKPEGNTYFELSPDDEAYKAKAGTKDKPTHAELHQPFCAFIPNSLVMFTKYRDAKNKLQPTGQNLIIHNDTNEPKVDKGIPHNSKVTNPKGEVLKNESINPGSKMELTALDPSPSPYSVGCSIHPWMNANLWVLDNPYFAVTDENGNFKIEHAPVGKVKLVVWHAGTDFVNGKDGTVIDTKDGDNPQPEFKIKK